MLCCKIGGTTPTNSSSTSSRQKQQQQQKVQDDDSFGGGRSTRGKKPMYAEVLSDGDEQSTETDEEVVGKRRSKKVKRTDETSGN